jgi:hypothetical protein
MGCFILLVIHPILTYDGALLLLSPVTNIPPYQTKLQTLIVEVDMIQYFLCLRIPIPEHYWPNQPQLTNSFDFTQLYGVSLQYNS